MTTAPVPARGAGLSRTALVGGVLVAAALGLGAFAFLATVDPVSTDPLAGTGGWFALVVVGLLGAAVVPLLALLAVLVARPRTVAVVALGTCVLLPAASLVVGGLVGVAALKAHVAADLVGGGGAVLASLDGLLRSWGIDPRPLIDQLGA